MKLYRNFFKRVIDFTVSLVAFCILLPFFLIITLLLLFANQGKPFFVQRRPGKDQRIFLLVKFKTMNDRKDASGNLLPDEKRLTALGKFIRRTSLDEIPQLINVLKGEMSLVGPRPLLVEYLPLYDELFARALAVGGKLFVVTGERQPQTALLVTRTAEAGFHSEGLFETAIDALENARRPDPFQF